MIDVIIPAYNAHKTIKRTLFSIATQINKDDLKVYIVNDCSEKDYYNEIDFFSKFLNITELKLEKNSGPGAARQYGIDHSKSDYIVFIDSDDEFASTYAIKRLYDEINDNHYDQVISSFYDQKENLQLFEVIGDTSWLHGKIYRRKFLEENGIRFNNTSANEDNGFNQLLFLHDSKIGSINDFTYIWKYTSDSITRRNNAEYNYKGIIGFIYNMTWAFEIAEKKNLITDKFIKTLYETVVAIYYYYLEFIHEKDINNLLLESNNIVKMYAKYNNVNNIDKNIGLCDEFMFMSKSLDTIDLLNLPINFNDFIELVLKTK